MRHVWGKNTFGERRSIEIETQSLREKRVEIEIQLEKRVGNDTQLGKEERWRLRQR